MESQKENKSWIYGFSFTEARGLTLSGPMILILIAAILIVSIVTPIVQYFLWRDGRKK